MSTLLGMTLFSAIGAMVMGRVYDFFVGSTADGVASVGRWAVFTGTWTTISTASGVRGMSRTAGRFKKRTNVARSLIKKDKDK